MFGKSSGALDGAVIADQQQKFAALAELNQEITDLTAELDSLKNVPLSEGITEVKGRGTDKVIPMPTEASLQKTIDFAYDEELLRLEDEIQQLRQADAEKAATIQKLEYQLQEAIQRAEYAEDELAEAQVQPLPVAAEPATQDLAQKLVEIDRLQSQLTGLLKDMKAADGVAKVEAEAIMTQAQMEARQLLANSEAEVIQRKQALAEEAAAAQVNIQIQQQTAERKATDLLDLAEAKASGILSEAQQKAAGLEAEMATAIQEFRQQAASLNQRLASLKNASDAAFDELMVKGQQLTETDWKGGSLDADH